jgi:hypothetical protein
MKQLNVFGTRPTDHEQDLDLVLVLLRLGLPRQILVFSLEFDRVSLGARSEVKADYEREVSALLAFLLFHSLRG